MGLAQLRGAQLGAVIVEEIPVLPHAPQPPTVATGPDGERRAATRATLADSLTTALGSSPDVTTVAV